MQVVLAIDNHFPGYGGPFTALSQTAKHLYLNGVDFKLIYERNEFVKYNLDYKQIFQDAKIVHIFGIWTPWFIKTYKTAKKLKKKVIVSPLGATEPWSLDQKKIKKKIAWHLYQKNYLDCADYIHATSVDEKSHLLELGVKAPIIVLPHGIEVVREKKKIQIQTPRKAIFFSRIHEKKGLLELVNSWKNLNNKDWILQIYGPVSDSIYLNKVKKLIKYQNLNSEIKIFDPVYDIKSKENILNNSDCFILPSKSENFGLSIGEALSYGLPTLTTTATPWSLINKYNAGIVFDFSQDNLTYSLKKFLSSSDDEFKAMSINAKKLILENYDFSKIIKGYINFYNLMAENK